MVRLKVPAVLVLLSAALSACGTVAPGKHFGQPDLRHTEEASQDYGQSEEGIAEANLVANIRCEIQNAVYLAWKIKSGGKSNVAYIGEKWGTQVTLKLTWDEQSTISPGISFIKPGSSSQSRSIGLGGAQSSHATRTESVTFMYANSDLIQSELKDIDASKDKKTLPNCATAETGTMINSDLKIADFVVDKATLAGLGIASSDVANDPPFTAFTEDLTFVGSYSGNITPTWKLTRFTANTSNFLTGTRTTTGEIIITLGPLAQDEKTKLYLHKLADMAAAQHTAAFGAAATATQNKANNQ